MPIATLLCLVVAVVDGDTLHARCGSEARAQTVVVRLADIDAPEKCQSYGANSKAALAELVDGKKLEVESLGFDRYGRTLARVRTEDGVDVNATMVERGAAWVFRRYSNDPRLLNIEADARRYNVGLWANTARIEPWEFRRAPMGCEITSSGANAVRPPSATAVDRDSAQTSTDVAAIMGALVARSEKESRAQVLGGYTLQRYTDPTVRTGRRGGRYTITESNTKHYLPKNGR